LERIVANLQVGKVGLPRLLHNHPPITQITPIKKQR
jgi:hypothetical protein